MGEEVVAKLEGEAAVVVEEVEVERSEHLKATNERQNESRLTRDPAQTRIQTIRAIATIRALTARTTVTMMRLQRLLARRFRLLGCSMWSRRRRRMVLLRMKELSEVNRRFTLHDYEPTATMRLRTDKRR